MRVPKRTFVLESVTLLIFAMHNDWKARDEILAKEGWTGRSALGYKLPAWQRKEKWTDEQRIRFIQSIYKGISPGTFMYNETYEVGDLDRILLDGQQRLMALHRYWSGELAVPGEDGIAYLWTDLTHEEQRHFLRMNFGCCVSRYTTEEQCKIAYNLHNFGGTAHTEDERA